MTDLWTWPLVATMSIGLFLAAGVASRPTRGDGKWWLVVLLVAAACFAGEFAAMRVGWYAPPVVFVTYPLFFLLGPAAWFMTRALAGLSTPLWSAAPHFLPAVAAAVDLSPYYADLAVAGGQPVHGGRTLSGLGGYGQCLIQLTHTGAYAAAVSALFGRAEQVARDVHSGDAVERVRWSRRVSTTLWIVIVVELGATVAMMLLRHHVLAAEYAMGLAVAALVVALGWMVVQQPDLLESPARVGSYRKSSLGAENLAGYAHRLLEAFDTERLWLKSDLRLGHLSTATGIPRHHLSQVLSRTFGLTFFDFVNAYRVREAARQLLEEDPDKTMLAVAYDSGFSSKASFNRVFKGTLGMTPSQFRSSGTLAHPAIRAPSPRESSNHPAHRLTRDHSPASE